MRETSNAIGLISLFVYACVKIEKFKYKSYNRRRETKPTVILVKDETSIVLEIL
jgi:hypothetical protein